MTTTTEQIAQSLVREAKAQRDAQMAKASALVRSRAVKKLSQAEEVELEVCLREASMHDNRSSRYGRVASEAREAEERSARGPVVYVRGEPLTYERHGRHSFFRDLARAAAKGDSGSAEARSRLDRHKIEMDVELVALQRDTERRAADHAARLGAAFERRVAPNRTVGQGGYLAPPLWMVREFAAYPRPERVVADLAVRFPLADSPGFQSVNVPRLTAGTSESTPPDLSAIAVTDITDTALSSPIVPIVGIQDTALQLLEQSPAAASLDWVLGVDLLSAYDATLEAQLVNGTGSNGQLLGLLNVSGTNGVTYTSGSPTVTGLYPLLGEAFGQLADARKLRPQAWLMRGARWAWLASALDANSRPIVVPGPQAMPVPEDEAPGPAPIAPLLGVPAYTDEAIPSTLGSGANQDAAIACRPHDLLLWETEAPRYEVMPEVLSGTLGARFRLRGYAGFIPGRYPSSIATVTGTGLVVQSGF